MDAEFSTVITSKEEAVELYEKYFRTLDESVFAPMIRGMMTHEFEGVFAIMRGSGNEVSIPGMAKVLLCEAGFFTDEEAMLLVDMEFAARKARAA